MKYIKSLALFLLVVGFPIGSWYYLQKGLDYRKAALEELKPKALISTYVDLSNDQTAIFNNKTSLLIMPSSETDPQDIQDIYDQFYMGYTFQLVNANRAYTMPEEENDKWKDITINEADKSFKFALIDQENHARGFYGETTEEKRRLVEHMAILLPRKPEKDIVEK